MKLESINTAAKRLPNSVSAIAQISTNDAKCCAAFLQEALPANQFYVYRGGRHVAVHERHLNMDIGARIAIFYEETDAEYVNYLEDQATQIQDYIDESADVGRSFRETEEFASASAMLELVNTALKRAREWLADHYVQALGYANRIGFSDVEPFEVISHVSEKCYVIRSMQSHRRNPEDDLGCQVGGFAAHHSRQRDQKWFIYPSFIGGYCTKIRLHKDGVWRDKDGNAYRLGNQPVRFYDYNF